jgi:hypothetical protein
VQNFRTLQQPFLWQKYFAQTNKDFLLGLKISCHLGCHDAYKNPTLYLGNRLSPNNSCLIGRFVKIEQPLHCSKCSKLHEDFKISSSSVFDS